MPGSHRFGARSRAARRIACALALVVGLAAGLGTNAAWAQPVDPEKRDTPGPATDRPQPAPGVMQAMEAYEGRPVHEVRLTGLDKTDPQLIKNSLRTRAGQPLSPETVREDIHAVNRLGRFKGVSARVVPLTDGSVDVVYEFKETPVIRAVDIVGNRQIANSEIGPVVDLLKGVPVDEFELNAARANIERLYRDKGYYLATVTIDEKELERGNVLFRVAEGERVRVTDIQFEGNKAFQARQITPHIKTTTAGIFETGPVDPEQLNRDVQSIVEFYKDRGYLDVRADKQVVFAPNGKEAIVRFVVDEGPLYTLRSVKVELESETGGRSLRAPTVISPVQVAGLMEIKAGDVYSVERVRRSVDALTNAYRRMGYGSANVVNLELRDPTSPQVDLLLMVYEGERSLTGLVVVKGNTITQEKVILRELTNLKPDRPLDMSFERLDGRTVLDAEQRLRDTNLFDPNPTSTKITLQPADPADPLHRDVLIEVKETNTGSLSFGVGAGSDSGLSGLISLNQRNFDVADVPDSWSEFFAGRSFRGAGQTFNISLQPGTEVQTYSIGLTEPYLFDTDYSGNISGFYFKRQYDQYDERRIGAVWGIGRRFGERWVGNIAFRYNDVNISNIEPDAPTDLFAVKGDSVVTGIGVNLTRQTLDSKFRPSKGSKTKLGVERAGAMGGDYDFTNLSFEHQVFVPVYESFLGYRTVLSWHLQMGYIPEGPDHAPMFERLYLGGRSFRGFKYRTISPKGIRNDNGQPSDEPVGGTWLFFTGLQLQQPLWKDIVSGVVFIDSGTVTNSPGFGQYRVSTGVGLRIAVPQLGPVPLAFDFGFPLLKEDRDSKRLFSFTLELPF